ncbi:hypothetical protein CEXT_716961 [Caerostris extrusa]|uniref:Uncharacterized protein n=1 Tax=Caerostris extrusa TaxID=172846 RepID=A0AAV4P7D3_CAEEX|nr:hypothetical protein CEXT_716961 [Caerostris extrusa]
MHRNRVSGQMVVDIENTTGSVSDVILLAGKKEDLENPRKSFRRMTFFPTLYFRTERGRHKRKALMVTRSVCFSTLMAKGKERRKQV